MKWNSDLDHPAKNPKLELGLNRLAGQPPGGRLSLQRSAIYGRSQQPAPGLFIGLGSAAIKFIEKFFGKIDLVADGLLFIVDGYENAIVCRGRRPGFFNAFIRPAITGKKHACGGDQQYRSGLVRQSRDFRCRRRLVRSGLIRRYNWCAGINTRPDHHEQQASQHSQHGCRSKRNVDFGQEKRRDAENARQNGKRDGIFRGLQIAHTQCQDKNHRGP